MYFNKKAVERELDLASEELEKFGYVDLADKVDYYNERLMEVKSSKEIPIIRRALQRVEREASRRQSGKKESKTIDKRKLAELKKKARERKLIKTLKDRKTAKPNARTTRLEALLKQRDAKIASEDKKENLKAKVKARRLARLKAALGQDLDTHERYGLERFISDSHTNEIYAIFHDTESIYNQVVEVAKTYDDPIIFGETLELMVHEFKNSNQQLFQTVDLDRVDWEAVALAVFEWENEEHNKKFGRVKNKR